MSKIGIFVDMANVSLCGGRGMRVDVLRQFAEREGGTVVRANVYRAVDAQVAKEDPSYTKKGDEFKAVMKDAGFRCVDCPVEYYMDNSDVSHPRCQTELACAVEMLTQGTHLDQVIVVSGDSDYSTAVMALQRQGVRVEGVGFRRYPDAMREAVDYYQNGYLVPNLLLPSRPSGNKGPAPAWGEVGSRVRGICYDWRPERAFGFLRVLCDVRGILHVDTRHPESGWVNVFIHRSELPEEIEESANDLLPSRHGIFEFEIKAKTGDGDRQQLEAKNVRLILS